MKLIKFTMQDSYAREHGNYLRIFCVYSVMFINTLDEQEFIGESCAF